MNKITPESVALHALHSLEADAGTLIQVDGRLQLCDTAMMKRLAGEYLRMAEQARLAQPPATSPVDAEQKG